MEDRFFFFYSFVGRRKIEESDEYIFVRKEVQYEHSINYNSVTLSVTRVCTVSVTSEGPFRRFHSESNAPRCVLPG